MLPVPMCDISAGVESIGPMCRGNSAYDSILDGMHTKKNMAMLAFKINLLALKISSDASSTVMKQV